MNLTFPIDSKSLNPEPLNEYLHTISSLKNSCSILLKPAILSYPDWLMKYGYEKA